MLPLPPVSIHAPARGATSDFLDTVSRGAMFQSTRPRGARPDFLDTVSRGAVGFNPRAREGRDRGLLWSPLFSAPVSIHAPARGATCNPVIRRALLILFQSTRPRGARHRWSRRRSPPSMSFNPRAREGRDIGSIFLFLAHSWFQSTRPRGARRGGGRAAEGSG